MMHPKIDYPGIRKPVIDDLSRPRHAASIRDRSRRCRKGTEVTLARGFRIEADAFTGEPHLEVLLDGLRRFMTVALEVRERSDGYPLRLRRRRPDGLAEGAREAHAIDVRAAGCDIAAADLDGLRRAVFYVEDEMTLRRAPLLPIGVIRRSTTLAERIIRSPIAPYRWLSGWELDDPHDYYPEAYLERLAHDGINGLWIPGLLRKLVAVKTIPELGPPEHRLGKLKAIIAKAARHGIRIYLFCIEPRALPAGHPALAAHPEIDGARHALCGSSPLVLDYVREVMRNLFTEVPDLAGVINIFCGERPTTCWWSPKIAAECPSCAARPRAEMLSRTLNAFLAGIRDAGSDATFMAWTYLMDSSRETSPIAPMLDVMRQTDPGVTWLGNFEHGCFTEVAGKRVQMHEYSLSCTGPSDYFRDMVQAARQHGCPIYAKLQIGTSYELSSVPYIPVPGIEHDKLRIAAVLGVGGSMMTWIPGGFPGPMTRAAGQASFDHARPREDFLLRQAAIDWGEAAARDVTAAWEIFAAAWQRYPVAIDVLYWGPITRGPAYQLHLEREPRLGKPYNWGFTRKRETHPWEDQIARWLGPYTPAEIADVFRGMAGDWQTGLDRLQAALRTAGDTREPCRQTAIARAIRLHFLSAANVYEFYALRDSLREQPLEVHAAIVSRMHDIARDDSAVAAEMLTLLDIEPLLGYESELFAFSYDRCLLAEKILQVQDLLPTLVRWAREGIDPAVLERTVEEAELLRPDRDPDRWGD